jgi:polysaccharide export outer membrane protein
MNTLVKIFAVALLMLATQACNTTGSTTSPGAALPADPVAAPGTPSADLKGEFVPAVVGIPADPGPMKTYRIGPYDLLKIEVFQVEELSSEERVNDEGFVVMPLIGNVKVGGLTPREAEQAIANKLGESYLQNPQVNIFVAEYASQKVTVTGNVKKPGVFPLAGQTTLMQAIAMAGGLDEVANKDEIVVFRKQPTGKVNAYVVDMEAIEEGRLTDPAIVGDDRIVVPKSGAAVLTRAIGNVLTGWAVRAPLY